MIPPSCFDNFYEHPDSVRDFALSLDYYSAPEDCNYPGERTLCLSSIDFNFFQYSICKLFSSFFDVDTLTNVVGNTYFQKIYPYHEQQNHPMNTGWAHIDDCVEFAAVIYLNKDTCFDSGTTIVHPNNKFTDSCLNTRIKPRHDLYHNYPVDEKLYIESIKNHNDKFDFKSEFKNKYNRMIAYNGETWHKESSFWVPEEFRLTQLFFIESVDGSLLKKIS